MSGISLDQVILSATTSSIAISDGTDTLAVEANGSINVNILGGINVEVDLSHVDDSVKIGDGTDFMLVNADGSINVKSSSDVDDDAPHTENGVSVAGRAVSGLLAALSTTGDKYDLLADLYRRTWVNTSRNIAVLNSAATVTSTAAQVLVSPLAGRRELTIQNVSNTDAYLGSSAGVTSTTGLLIPKQGSATYELAEDIDIFMVTASGSANIRFWEMA
jgi:hypothetical protein